MLDRYLNPTPTIYKWDKFWVGFVPALVTPFLGLLGVFAYTHFTAKYNHGDNFTFHMFLVSLQSKTAFMKISTLCAMLNGAVFFFFVRKDYNNASRAVMITTMLFVMAILIKEIL